MKRSIVQWAMAGVVLVLAACGGGGGGGDSAGSGGSGAAPASNAFLDATGRVIGAAGTDAAEPVDVTTVAASQDETAEPVTISAN